MYSSLYGTKVISYGDHYRIDSVHHPFVVCYRSVYIRIGHSYCTSEIGSKDLTFYIIEGHPTHRRRNLRPNQALGGIVRENAHEHLQSPMRKMSNSLLLNSLRHFLQTGIDKVSSHRIACEEGDKDLIIMLQRICHILEDNGRYSSSPLTHILSNSLCLFIQQRLYSTKELE